MGRSLLIVSLLGITVFLLWNLIFTSEIEQVESSVQRLVDRARQGGAGAVDEILDALSDDYRGESPFDRASVVRRLNRYLGDTGFDLLETGSINAIKMDDEIVIPLLRIRARTRRGVEGNVLLALFFAESAEGWRIVDIKRAEFGR